MTRDRRYRLAFAAEYERNEAAAAAEYGAEFRRDVEPFITRAAIEAVVIPGRRELPPVSSIQYVAFCDPSGGSQDAMTLAIAHHDDGRAVLDAIRGRRPPFSPESVVKEFAELLKAYGVSTVAGDRCAGEWPRERFRQYSVEYKTADKSKSDIYRDALPLLNSGRAELLDLPRLHAQFLGLERRTSRAGRDSIDHGPGGHDAVAGALWRCERLSAGPPVIDVAVHKIYFGRQPDPAPEPPPREPGRIRVSRQEWTPWW